MDVLGQYLDDRTARTRAGADDRRKAAELWQATGRRPEERLLAFDRWLRGELESRLDWAWAGAHKQKRIEQCRMHLERVVLDLWQRGWMLDGKRLAGHLQSLLDNVAAYQRKGGIQDFWAYFKSASERYVGGNAEELREEAMSAGSHIAQVMSVLGRPAAPSGPRMGDLLQTRHQETLREKLAQERRKHARLAVEEKQATLF